jgi:O-antigen/teichoic acid export membrane protein
MTDVTHPAPHIAPVRLSARRLTATTTINLAGRIVGVALGVAVAAILTRSLGVATFGQLSLALALVGVAGTAGDFGLTQVAVRDMASHPEQRPALLGSLVTLRLLAGAVLTAGVVAVVVLMTPAGSSRVMGVLIALTIPIGALAALQAGAQARLRPELMTLVTLGQGLAWLVVVAFLMAVGGSPAWYGAGFLAAAMVQAGLAWIVLRPVSSVSWGFGRGVAGPLVRSALPLGLAGLFVTAYYRIDGVILYELKGPEQAAYYAAAYRFLDVLQLFPATALIVLLPLLASLERRGEEERRQRVIQAALLLLGVVALPVVVGGMLISGRLVDLLYGVRYRQSGELLVILLPVFLSICLGYVFTAILIAAKRLWPYALVALVAAVVNVGANLLVIPRYGAEAAAWTTLATEVPVMIAMVILARRAVPVTLPWSRWARTLCATVVMAAVVIAVRSQPLVLVIAAAVAAYAGSSVAVGALRRDDVRLLLSRSEGVRG